MRETEIRGNSGGVYSGGIFGELKSCVTKTREDRILGNTIMRVEESLGSG